MAEHKGLPVAGYQPQPQERVDAVNKMKECEENFLRLLDDMRTPAFDQRWLSIGRTHIEQGFMAINRSIFRPQRVQLAGNK